MPLLKINIRIIAAMMKRMKKMKRFRAPLLLTAMLLVFTAPFATAPFATAQTPASTKSEAAAAPASSQKAASDADKLDINTATAAQLKALPGIGDAYAAKIIAGRPYAMKTQLSSRGVLPKSTYSAIADKIVAHRPKK